MIPNYNEVNNTPSKKVHFSNNNKTIMIDSIPRNGMKKINTKLTPVKSILKTKFDENDYSLIKVLKSTDNTQKDVNVSDFEFSANEIDEDLCKKLALQKLNSLIKEENNIDKLDGVKLKCKKPKFKKPPVSFCKKVKNNPSFFFNDKLSESFVNLKCSLNGVSKKTFKNDC
jgi:hypothetical protein